MFKCWTHKQTNIMENLFVVKYPTFLKRSMVVKNLILSILVGNLTNLVYAVENQRYQTDNDILPGDLIHEKTLPIVREATPSLNTGNDNVLNLSPSFNANTKRLRHSRDTSDENTQLDGSNDNRQSGAKDATLNYDNNSATSNENSYFNISIMKRRNRYGLELFYYNTN